MKPKFGDTKGFDLTIFDDYARLERPDPTEPRRVLSYSYHGGWDDPSETSVSSDARLVDLAAFDVPTFVGLIRGAPETLGIDPAEVKQIHVERRPELRHHRAAGEHRDQRLRLAAVREQRIHRVRRRCLGEADQLPLTLMRFGELLWNELRR